MARIKLPEIKSGDSLSSDTFNEINDAFLDFKIDESNIRPEGINSSKIPSKYPFNRYESDPDSGAKVITKENTDNELCYFSSLDASLDATAQGSDVVSFSDESISTNDRFICRASARINMNDFGSRTFFSGIPPTLHLELYHAIYTDTTSPVLFTDFLRCNGTKQLFSCAFSSKIPSDSGGELMVANKMATLVGEDEGTAFISRQKEDRPDLITHAGTNIAGPSAHVHYDLNNNGNMFFHYDFSYCTATSVKVLATMGDVKRIVFCLFGSFYNPGGIQGTSDLGLLGASPEQGCGQVKIGSYFVRNANISIVHIRD
jgi:hypothetical protein